MLDRSQTQQAESQSAPEANVTGVTFATAALQCALLELLLSRLHGAHLPHHLTAMFLKLSGCRKTAACQRDRLLIMEDRLQGLVGPCR
jgi:hypothetical protein